jgi:hypothetical protein
LKNASHAIYAIIAILEKWGCKVITDLSLEPAGQIDYQARTIRINEPNAELALIAIAHEAGHYLHYLLDPDLESNFDIAERENIAFNNGWQILVSIGAVKAELISRLMYEKRDDSHR